MNWSVPQRWRWRRSTLCVILLCSIAFLIWLFYSIKAENVCFDSEPVYSLDGLWSVTVNGEKREDMFLPALIDVKAGDDIYLTTILPQENTVCNSIMFHSSHHYLEIYLDDTLLISYGQDYETPFPMSPGSAWQYTRLPNDWIGRELTIHLNGYYDMYAGHLNTVYLGTKASLIYMVFKGALPTLLLMIPVMTLGFVMIIASFFFREHTAKRKFRYLGLVSLTTGSWILLESQITQLFTGQILLCMNLLFILFSMIPIFIQSFLLSFDVFAGNRYSRGVFWLCVLFFFIIHLLNITGAADYMATVPLVHLQLILEFAGFGIIIALHAIRFHRPLGPDTKALVLAVGVFAVFGLMDILRFYFPGTRSATLFTQIGFCCFVLILGASAIRQEAASHAELIEKKTLERLAYIDILTGVKNRTAFEAQLQSLRELNTPRGIVMADMDNLKEINDSKGHSAGDQAIILMARELEKHFADQGICYRIGGDEFCVIGKTTEEGELLKRIGGYMEDIQKNEVEGCQISVSVGFAIYEDQTIEKALALADQRMYAEKNAKKAPHTAAPRNTVTF